jgi:hypothetical protein
MTKTYIFIVLFFNFQFTFLFAQEQQNINKLKDTLKLESYDPLRAAKASFYSAIVPGLGQIYNKKYWKVPIVYGAIGTSLYFYSDSKKKYTFFRDEYKKRLEGYKSESEYINKLTDSQLISAQKTYQRNKDFSALFVLGFYVLNIIDANVDASLSQFNVNDKLSLTPSSISNSINTSKANFGVSCFYTF